MADPTRILLPFDQGLLDPAEGALFIRPHPESPEMTGMVCEQGFKPYADRLIARGLNNVPWATGSYPIALINLTRSRVENQANIARASKLVQYRTIIVSGDKTDGIEAIMKAVKSRVAEVRSLSKSHGKVFWFSGLKADDWAEAGKMRQNSDGYTTCPGMFSYDKFDKGSKLLLQKLDKKLKGKIADLGAGWGHLSAEILKKHPDTETLDLFEAEHLALEAAKLNVKDSRAAFHWMDVTIAPKKSEYDTVIMNPPFHQSRRADAQIGVGFIAAAARMLKPSGDLHFVANRQLPYEQALDQYFHHWQLDFQDGIYKILSARRPR